MQDLREPPAEPERAGGGRRWWGVVILAGLTALTIVVAAGRSGVVPGRAVAVPVPGPPLAGDCLLENPHRTGADPYDLGWSVAVPLPSMVTGRCSGVRYGEVVSVDTGVRVGTAGYDDAFPRCLDSGYDHLGVPDPVSPEASHVAVVNIWIVLVGPDERQRAVGQDWSACVVNLPPTGAADGVVTVDHSLRDAWNDREDGALFAMCRSGSVPWEFTSCGRPHASEMVSFWTGDPAVPDGSNRDACRRDAIQWLGSPASLDRNELAVEVVYTRWDDGAGDVRIVEPTQLATAGAYDVECLLAPADGSRRLTGPVRGLGAAPVPFG